MSRPLELVLGDRTRVPLVGELTIGRALDSSLRLDDPAVSRRQARISQESEAVVLEDAGSTYGTWLDGHRVNGRTPLRDGARIRVGNQELLVEARREEWEAGRTIVVGAGDSLELPAAGGAPRLTPGQPRVRSGYALKRLAATEGDRRWILGDTESGRFLRMSDSDAALFQLIDGRRTLQELLGEAEGVAGPAGPGLLARLLSELGERGLLAGVEGAAADAPQGRARRLMTPRELTWDGAGAWFERSYRTCGRWLFTAQARWAIAVLVVLGLATFPYLVAARYGTPFVVASKIGLGGLVFLVGRFAVVALHETAHGLAMARYGRRVRRAGLKLVLVFPYAFVDTSEAWFEPRRSRIAISAAGPVSDLLLGALFALTCLALPDGTVRDILFQLAFAAYLGACFNLNPFVERDGYQILVDVLGEPNLRRRARDELRRRLTGQGGDSQLLIRYAALGVVWTAVAACFAVGMSLRFAPRLEQLAPGPVVWTGFALVWLGLFVPVIAAVGGPLGERSRAREG